ncbi:MAG TPA: DUF1178 family protein [Pseudolabrys sp.]|nr:DUF1178 family protein [Pseudolabrys sp.]
MIRYSLACKKEHAFESWFQDSAAFEKQAKRGLVSCPQCGSSEVSKAIMAPQVSDSKRRRKAATKAAAETIMADKPADAAPVAIVSPQEQALRTKLKELREHLLKNADHVGTRFPEEARKMHYGEIEHRSIYGEASLEQAKELAEEGIEVHPLPMLPEERN